MLAYATCVDQGRISFFEILIVLLYLYTFIWTDDIGQATNTFHLIPISCVIVSKSIEVSND